jgi:hypothetical protein
MRNKRLEVLTELRIRVWQKQVQIRTLTELGLKVWKKRVQILTLYSLLLPFPSRLQNSQKMEIMNCVVRLKCIKPRGKLAEGEVRAEACRGNGHEKRQ